jgi:hypothetical protein
MKSKTTPTEPVITDEIPSLRDFMAVSIISGAIAGVGVPVEDTDEEFYSFMARFSYKMADAMLVEKYKNNTRH